MEMVCVDPSLSQTAPCFSRKGQLRSEGLQCGTHTSPPTLLPQWAKQLVRVMFPLSASLLGEGLGYGTFEKPSTLRFRALGFCPQANWWFWPVNSVSAGKEGSLSTGSQKTWRWRVDVVREGSWKVCAHSCTRQRMEETALGDSSSELQNRPRRH